MKQFTTNGCLRIRFLFFLVSMIFLSCESDVKEMTISINSRMYPNFHEEHVVKMYQKFPIADGELEGVAVEFFPDFTIDTLTHKAISMSDTLNNPAIKILIIKGREKKEEVWAFPPGMLPHFSPRSFLGFELIDFKVGGKYIKPATGKAITGNENE